MWGIVTPGGDNANTRRGTLCRRIIKAIVNRSPLPLCLRGIWQRLRATLLTACQAQAIIIRAPSTLHSHDNLLRVAISFALLYRTIAFACIWASSEVISDESIVRWIINLVYFYFNLKCASRAVVLIPQISCLNITISSTNMCFFAYQGPVKRYFGRKLLYFLVVQWITVANVGGKIREVPRRRSGFVWFLRHQSYNDGGSDDPTSPKRRFVLLIIHACCDKLILVGK